MLVFAKFTELQTDRQVPLWMRQERLPLPATEYGPEGFKVVFYSDINILCGFWVGVMLESDFTEDIESETITRGAHTGVDV